MPKILSMWFVHAQSLKLWYVLINVDIWLITALPMIVHVVYELTPYDFYNDLPNPVRAGTSPPFSVLISQKATHEQKTIKVKGV